MLFHGERLKAFPLRSGRRQRLHLYKMFTIGKSIETESRVEVAQAQGSWEDWGGWVGGGDS